MMDLLSPNRSTTPPGSSAAGRRPSFDAVSAIDAPSPLLMRRLHQQKQLLSQAKAEAKRHSSNSLAQVEQTQCTSEKTPGTPERKIYDPTQDHSYSSSSPRRPGSSGKANRRSAESGRKIEGMGVREQSEFLSKLQKENFDLKLSLYHLREKATKNEAELDNIRTQLNRVQARNEELGLHNEQLQLDLQERDVALDGACKQIAVFEDQLADIKEKGKAAQEAAKDLQGVTSLNTDSTLVSGRPIPFGVSPYAPRESLTTPFYQDGKIPCSPCLSDNSNLIDLNTPYSIKSSPSLIKAVLLSGERHTPMRQSLTSRGPFLDRCTSALSESPVAGKSPSSDSSLESLPSMISEGSLSMYGGRDNNGNDIVAGDSFDRGNLGLFDDEEVPMAKSNSAKRWTRHHVEIMNALTHTPSRKPSPTRRSPRSEIMEYKDKQDKQDKLQQRSQDTGRNMPPTPESISPQGTVSGSFGSSSYSDEDEASCGLGLVSPIEGTDGSKTETVSGDRKLCRSANTIPQSTLAPSPLHKSAGEIPGKLKAKRSLKFPSGDPVAQKEQQTLGDITNMRDTHKRLGYGFGNKLGNRATPSKQPGRDITNHARKRPVSKKSKEPLVAIPVKSVATGLPVRSRTKMTTPQPEQGLNTPPYTPNSDSTGSSNGNATLASRDLAKKISWEEPLNSGPNSNSDKVKPRSTHNSPYAIGIKPLTRRNSVAAAAATSLSAVLNKRVNDVVAARRTSGIPALVRGGSMKGKERPQWQE